MKHEMTSKERIMTALLGKELPDRVPWFEMEIALEFQEKLMGKKSYTPEEFALKMGVDAIGSTLPCVELNFFPPTLAPKLTYNGTSTHGEGILKSRDYLHLLQLPEPAAAFKYLQIKEWLNSTSRNLAVYAKLRFGCISTILSMGLENFALALHYDISFIEEVFYKYSSWCEKIIDIINELPFDFYIVAEDLGFSKGPFMSPGTFKKMFLPTFSRLAGKLNKPWVLHSDGNILPLLDDLLTLGFSGLHPIDPSCMDLAFMKKKYGSEICLIGNVDIRHTLTSGTLEEVEQEVYEKITLAAPGGRYILSSANSITNYCKLENVLAMGQAVKKYGKY
ncbi:uroporphyrinogen decarboxylase family protein [Desulfitibacter alkalitolerans]|uniref:uroporphyrinogen decarboxylase family protein n=1 Tax=Desulfitibacter alkalitolerans TaxID=264641 RepID=UPI000483CC91|nr:uroporphyrinogen decarboxylase family protein [Desulfitibacter alkalitolerans]